MTVEIALQPRGALARRRHSSRHRMPPGACCASISGESRSPPASRPQPETEDAIVFPKPAGLKILATPLPGGQFVSSATLCQTGREPSCSNAAARKACAPFRRRCAAAPSNWAWVSSPAPRASSMSPSCGSDAKSDPECRHRRRTAVIPADPS